jgi:hypothetical protein
MRKWESWVGAQERPLRIGHIALRKASTHRVPQQCSMGTVYFCMENTSNGQLETDLVCDIATIGGWLIATMFHRVPCVDNSLNK